jgi:hypothetical protein
MSENQQPDPRSTRRQLFTRTHRKASLRRWIIPLIIILAVIFFLPRLVEILVPQ